MRRAGNGKTVAYGRRQLEKLRQRLLQRQEELRQILAGRLENLASAQSEVRGELADAALDYGTQEMSCLHDGNWPPESSASLNGPCGSLPRVVTVAVNIAVGKLVCPGWRHCLTPCIASPASANWNKTLSPANKTRSNGTAFMKWSEPKPTWKWTFPTSKPRRIADCVGRRSSNPLGQLCLQPGHP
jgi:hypothetical protein